jgi:hypothetical protein
MDSDDEKENDPDHPGHGWMRYDSCNNEHYPYTSTMAIYSPRPLTSATSSMERILSSKGTDGKLYPIYRKALHSRSHSGNPTPLIINSSATTTFSSWTRDRTYENWSIEPSMRKKTPDLQQT